MIIDTPDLITPQSQAGSSSIAAEAGASSPHSAALAEVAVQHVKRVLEKIPLMGSVVWLMMQHNAVRHTLISELDWRVMPALVLEQCKLYVRDGAPVAFASWARLSDAAAQRYEQAPHQLMPSDWRSGEQVWLMDVFTPFGGEKEVLRDLRENVLTGHAISRLMPDGTGGVERQVWPATSAPEPRSL